MTSWFQRKNAAPLLPILLASGAVAIALLAAHRCAAAETDVERGRYLVTIAGCNHCHTPGYLLGKPDENQFLGGSDVGFFLPHLGIFVGPNLTGDKETGLGNWSQDDIVKALQTGITPDGRDLAPIMPWHDFAELKRSDADAIAAYLKTIPIVKHQVAGPFGPDEKPKIAVFKVLAPSDPN